MIMVIDFFGKVLSSYENRRLERIWKIGHIDFKKRYYDNYLGLIWALLNPIFRIAVYYFVFTRIIVFDRIDNYALYLFSGLIIWLFFVETTKNQLKLFNTKKYLLESIQMKVPDLFYSSSISSGIGFLFNFSAYLVIALMLGVSFSWKILLFPLVFVTAVIIATGVGMILATIKIYFRDINNFWDLAVLLGFWTCPIFVRGSMITEKAPFLFYLNPMAGLIDSARPMLLTQGDPNFFWLLYDLGYALVLFTVGRYLVAKHAKMALELV